MYGARIALITAVPAVMISIIGGLIANGASASSIEVVDVASETCDRLVQKFGVKACTSLAQAHLHPVVVLAVKPQQLLDVAKQIGPRLGDRLVVSIAAGVRLGDLSRWLGGHAAIVRARHSLLGSGCPWLSVRHPRTS